MSATMGHLRGHRTPATGRPATRILLSESKLCRIQDRAKGIRTLPVLLGDRISRASVLVMLALQYGIVFQLVLGGRLRG